MGRRGEKGGKEGGEEGEKEDRRGGVISLPFVPVR